MTLAQEPPVALPASISSRATDCNPGRPSDATRRSITSPDQHGLNIVRLPANARGAAPTPRRSPAPHLTVRCSAHGDINGCASK